MARRRHIPMNEPLRIDVWSDVVCPWCYIGKRRLESALATLPPELAPAGVEVVYHSFQLAPDFPLDVDEPALDYLVTHKRIDEARARQLQAHVTDVAVSVGLEYHFETARIANTHRAHELLHFGLEHGAQSEVKERLLKAHFIEGRSIGDIETLAAIATEAGLDADAARGALRSGAYVNAVEQDKALAARIGITGVPFHVFDMKVGMSGAQEPAALIDAIRQSRRS